MIKQNTRIVAALLGATALSACGGGGGGGGGGYTPNPPSPVLYYTPPVQQVTVDPMAGANDNAWFVGDTFIEDIDGDGSADDIIVAGRKHNLLLLAHGATLN